MLLYRTVPKQAGDLGLGRMPAPGPTGVSSAEPRQFSEVNHRAGRYHYRSGVELSYVNLPEGHAFRGTKNLKFLGFTIDAN